MIQTSLDPIKLQALKDRRSNGLSTFIYELVAAYWPKPADTKFYTCMPLDQASNCTGLITQLEKITTTPVIETRFEVGKSSGAGNWFRDITISSGVQDTVVNLDFSDTDRTISNLLLTYGEGVKAEIFYYFPDVDLLASIWWGHLQAPDSMDGINFKASAASGFRSILLNLPKRIFAPFCIAQFGPQVRAQLGNSLPILSDCPYDADIGGSHGLLDANGKAFLTCPKLKTSCQERFGLIPNLPWLGFDVTAQPSGNVVYYGPHTVNVTQGNDTNLHNPVRVIFGERTMQSLDLLQFTIATNTNNPDNGSLTGLFAVAEGPDQSIDQVQMDGIFAPISTNIQTQLGTIQQSPTAGFSVPHIINNDSYSSTAILDVIIKGDYRTASYSSITGSCHIFGLSNVNEYNADGTIASSNMSNGQNPAWALLRCITDKRWGMGEDIDRVVLQDWIDLADYCDDDVTFTDASGAQASGIRFTFNAELNGRSAQDQIKDICMFRWFTPPFPFEGKTRIMPLTAETLDNTIPLFQDFGKNRNIMWEGSPARTTVTWKLLSFRVLPNQLTVQFDDADNFNVTRPLIFNDEEAQLASGQAFGDTSLRVVTKLYSMLGGVHLGEVARSANFLLDRGEFDSGGLVNPLSVTFKTHITDCLGLHKYSIIQVASSVLTEVSAIYGQYYRITDLKFKGGQATITAQIYPAAYMNNSESNTQIFRPGQTIAGGGNGGGSPSLPIIPPLIIEPKFSGNEDPDNQEPDILSVFVT